MCKEYWGLGNMTEGGKFKPAGRNLGIQGIVRSKLLGVRMSVWDRLKGRTLVECRESEGVGSALETFEMFKGRTFRIKGCGVQASHVPTEEVVRFIQEELPGYYTYTTRVQTYADRHKIRQARVEIKGWIGLSRRMNRYNPFDWTCIIKTEIPGAA